MNIHNYQIKSKATGEIWQTHRRKKLWTGIAYAKNAFGLSTGTRFNDQNDYEIVPVVKEEFLPLYNLTQQLRDAEGEVEMIESRQDILDYCIDTFK